MRDLGQDARSNGSQIYHELICIQTNNITKKKIHFQYFHVPQTITASTIGVVDHLTLADSTLTLAKRRCWAKRQGTSRFLGH